MLFVNRTVLLMDGLAEFFFQLQSISHIF